MLGQLKSLDKKTFLLCWLKNFRVTISSYFTNQPFKKSALKKRKCYFSSSAFMLCKLHRNKSVLISPQSSLLRTQQVWGSMRWIAEGIRQKDPVSLSFQSPSTVKVINTTDNDSALFSSLPGTVIMMPYARVFFFTNHEQSIPANRVSGSFGQQQE